MLSTQLGLQCIPVAKKCSHATEVGSSEDATFSGQRKWGVVFIIETAVRIIEVLYSRMHFGCPWALIKRLFIIVINQGDFVVLFVCMCVSSAPGFCSFGG
jgi:hypothetical protein